MFFPFAILYGELENVAYTFERTVFSPCLGEPVDGGLAGAVRRVVVEGEERSRARRGHDLASGAALDHPPSALLRQDEGCPHVHLNRNITVHAVSKHQYRRNPRISSETASQGYHRRDFIHFHDLEHVNSYPKRVGVKRRLISVTVDA